MLTLATLVLSVLGLGVAGYLTYVHYNHNALVCTTGGCETVQSSKYATLGPLPIAVLGVGMYLALGALAAARRFRADWLAFDTATILAWVAVAAGVAYAAYLTYLELFVINAICQWCVTSAIISVLILACESVLLWKTVIAPPDLFD